MYSEWGYPMIVKVKIPRINISTSSYKTLLPEIYIAASEIVTIESIDVYK